MQTRLFKAIYCIFQRTNQANVQFQTFLTIHKQEYTFQENQKFGFEFRKLKIFTLEKTQPIINPKAKKAKKAVFVFFHETHFSSFL